MSDGEDLAQMYEDLVRVNGDDVLIHTQTCVEWKAEHENCKDCPSQLGCGKAVALMMVSVTHMMYEPKSFDDYERMLRSMKDKSGRILEAKTDEELKAIV